MTTLGDLVARGVAIPERLAPAAAGTVLKSAGVGALPAFLPHYLGDTGIHIADDTRDTGGDQVIAGVGFTSSVIIFFACDTTASQENLSWGFDDGTVHMCTNYMVDGTAAGLSAGYSILINRDGGNNLGGVVSAIGGDGFTITWTLVGACGAKFLYLCLP